MGICRRLNKVILGITKAAFVAADIIGFQCQNYLGRDVCKLYFNLDVGPFRNAFWETPGVLQEFFHGNEKMIPFLSRQLFVQLLFFLSDTDGSRTERDNI